MALTVYTQDLDNYPGISKRVSIDVASVIPVGEEGDEKIVMSVSTSAYSNNVSRTAIQDYYMTGFGSGWCKSSGFAGTANKFALDATHNKLKVKIDATISGSDGSGYYEIELYYETTPLSGDTIAADMEDKIRALALNLNTADTGFRLAYKTTSVYYQDGKFWVVSGSLGTEYTGPYRSSVKIAAADTNDASTILGFNLAVDSETMAGLSIKETTLYSSYTGGTSPMLVTAGLGASEGKCFMITDGTNTEYFTALSGTIDSSIVVPVAGVNGFDGVVNTYNVSETKIQLLTAQDPDVKPSSYYTSVDDVVRQSIKRMIAQIDYSS